MTCSCQPDHVLSSLLVSVCQRTVHFIVPPFHIVELSLLLDVLVSLCSHSFVGLPGFAYTECFYDVAVD